MGDGGCAVLSSRHPLAEFCNSEPGQREQLKSRRTTTLGTELGLSRLKGHSENASAHELGSSTWSPVPLSDMEHGSFSHVGDSSTERQSRRQHSRWDIRAEDIKVDVIPKGDACKHAASPLRAEYCIDTTEKERPQLVGTDMGGLNLAKEFQQTRCNAGRVVNDVLNQLEQCQGKEYKSCTLHGKTPLRNQHCGEDQLCERSDVTCMDCTTDERAPHCSKQETVLTKGIECTIDTNQETEAVSQLEKAGKPLVNLVIHSQADQETHTDCGIDVSASVRTSHNLQFTVLHYNRRSKKGSKEKKSGIQIDIDARSTISRSDCTVKDSEDGFGPRVTASNSLVTRDESLHHRDCDRSKPHSFTASDSCAGHHKESVSPATRPDELQADRATHSEPCILKSSFCEKGGKDCHSRIGDHPADNTYHETEGTNLVTMDDQHGHLSGGEMRIDSEQYSGHLHGTTTTDDFWDADMDVPMDLSPAPAEDDASSSLIETDNFGLSEHVATTSDALCGEPDSRGWIYLDTEGSTQGPVSLSLLKSYMRDGRLPCDHMVQLDGSNEWVTLEHAGLPIFGLRETLMPKPPTPSEVTASTSFVVLDDSAHLSSQLPEDLNIDNRVDRLMQGSTLVGGSEKEAILEALRNEHRHGHQESEQQLEDEDLSYSHVDPFANWSIDHFGFNEHGFQGETSSWSADGAVEPSSYSAFRSSRLWTSRGGDWKLMSQQENPANVKGSIGFGRPEKMVLNAGKPLSERMFHKLSDPRRGSSLYEVSAPKTLRLPPWAHHYWEAKGEYLNTISENMHTLLVSTPRSHITTPRDGPSVEASKKPKLSKFSSFSDRRPDEHLAANLHRVAVQQLVVSDHDEYLHGSSACQDMEISPEREEAPLATVDKEPEKLAQQVPTKEVLRLESGDWFYQDGNGQERGPYSFSHLQSKVRKGLLYEGRSVYRKSDDTWVPIYTHRPSKSMSLTSCPSKDGKDGEVRPSGQGTLLDFHKLYPQFIGFMCGKLHEYVMKSYKGREFAAMVDEGTRICLSNKRSRKTRIADVSAAEMKFDEDRSDFKHREGSFQDGVPSSISASFFSVDHLKDGRTQRMKTLVDIDDGRPYSGVIGAEGREWSMLEPRLLMNVFRYLDTDIRSLAFASSTCRLWRATVVQFKREIKQIDFSSLGSLCSDQIFRFLTEHAQNVSRVILRGCTSLSPVLVKAYLQGLQSIEFVDARGCDQLKELMPIFPQMSMSRHQHGGLDLHYTARSAKSSGEGRGTFTGKHPRGSDVPSPDDWKAKRLSFTNVLMDGVMDPMDCDTPHSVHSSSEVSQVGSSNDYKRLKLQSNGKLVKIGSDSSHSKTLSREYVLFARDKQISTSLSPGSEHKADLFPAVGDRRLEKEMAQVLQFLKDAKTSRSKKLSSLRCREMGLMKVEDKLRRGFYQPNLQGLRLFKSDLLDVARMLFRLKELEAGTIIFTNTFRLTDQLLQEFKGRGVLDSRLKEEAFKSGSSLSGRKRGIGSSLKQSSGKRRRKAHEDETSEEDECDYSFSSKSETSETDDDEDEVSQDDKDEDTDVSDSEVESESEGESMADTKKEVLSGDEMDNRIWGARMTKASMVPPETRKYELIEEYVVVADAVEVNKRMDVNLPEDYDKIVQAQEDRGIEYSHLEMPELREFKPRKHVQEEVVEQEVYGIDPYTHNLLIDTMPSNRSDFPDAEKHQLIEEDILKALNQEVRQFTGSGKAPTKFSIEQAVNRALEECTDPVKKSFIAGLAKNMRSRKESHTKDTYYAYRKGLGVVCNHATGFEKDEFIVEFFGEVYPAWRWFEKQDAIRSFQKKDKDPAPEFYNIFLERPKGDASGYDLVVVDAMHKANYASRICHSCRPNCEARVTAVSGRYQIGVYTLRPVEYGEELTFDYNSITESKEEHEKSVCLCGSSVCRGSYLNFAGPDTFQEIMKEDHNLLHRHDLLLRACIAGHATVEDWDVLKQAGLGSCLLDGLPGWTVKYAAEVVRFVNEERKFLPREIVKTIMSERKLERAGEAEAFEAEIQADGVFNSRLQNLAITLDKVRYVFKQLYGNPGAAPPPLRMLKPAEVAALIWTGENSVVSDLLQGMAQHSSKEDFADFKRKVNDHEPSESGDIEKNLRRSLIWLRDQLCRAPIGCMSRHDAAADLIHIYAHTKLFFTCQDYPTFESPSLTISPLDLGPKHAHKLGTATSFEWSKAYNKDYVLGQLIFWYKLNDAEPGSSLARASRGCLTLPDPSSCYAKSTQQRILYSSMDRLKMFRRMEHKQSRPWNWKGQFFWQFRNSRQLLGSPMMDSIHNGKSIDKNMMDWLKRRTRSF